MPANWGLFLCNCRRTIALDPERLLLPIVPSVLSFADEPEKEIEPFAGCARGADLERILIGCCAPQSLFDERLKIGPKPPSLHFLNLKELCFLPHADAVKAHAKAERMLRAAMESAEAAGEISYRPLTSGRRIVIVSDGPQGERLAERLKGVADPLLVALEGAAIDRSSLELKGRLGDFHLSLVEEAGGQRRSLKGDQVVFISDREIIPPSKRTGCHLLIRPDEEDLGRAAGRIHELVGEFLKPVQVTYHPEVCAGGTAQQEACGICVPACPYDAISRDPENPLRMKVDHMACEGCGACVSACPTSALRFAEPSPHELYTKLVALLAPSSAKSDGEAWTILFHCGEQGRRALEEAGRRSLSYPASVLPIEVPCLRYLSEANMLAPFRLGAAGVGLLGCERCQHGERELLYQKIDFCELVLGAFGLGEERLRLITAEGGAEAEAIGTLSSFADVLQPSPIRWDGQPLRGRASREVIAEAISAFIEQTGQEPGRRGFDAPHPFAFADVRESGCTMCRSCVNACPTHAFRLDEKRQALEFKHIACVACGLCEKVCPENVITLRREIFFERDALEYRTVVQDDMVSCAECGKPYVNRKALEAVEARVLSLGSLLDTFSGARRNLLRMCPDCRAVAAMLEVEKGWKP